MTRDLAMISTPTGAVQTYALAAPAAGRPTLVLLSGMGLPASSWFTAQADPQLAGMMREPVFLGSGVNDLTGVLAYDRAGQGSSAPPAGPTGLDDAVVELEAVLAACVSGPVVLLGHSLGGLVAFEFARRDPARVAGLVLLDSSHPAQARRLDAVRTPGQRAAQRELEQEIREGHPERWDFAQVFTGGREVVGALADLPLLVVSRGQPFLPEHLTLNERDPFTPAQAEVFTREWAALQSELAAASTRSRHVVAAGSGHYPHFDEPRLVLRELRAFLGER
ncbi:alpha/beta hydrolase [Deinococcus soli (ex Cha et al. 2016)]|jgi:pimeloyl-ACP methyl ester carboxylesterase|uniref:Pimeloyl-ACP methyl ester carboxylesterase n=2 Tax=Deinococcus soli (ex Cha et al. 2016) TaxID=1309411 RepID=A0ACC6KP87_9DEIO|nr:alpha/beta hydrolase [Deinococcus soli (ex Cha et al. 2016)]MDR6221310.1 pimeloyl-ACP methyl ester carboxylesterase [Deinococcus soli (ex Cha et al. 2016)]MDR6331279.1 pimeloyl-ACP methyl ester carboxylesterase [Deinococcus soli (ex Cha et al. 2016)]MDR6754459.1 pimeloyl-ACP methyl ester carboxylesterase [Deinococcus soli (ex Cha et al. 2016)]